MKVNQMYTEEDFLLKLQKAKFVHSGVFLPSYAMSFVTEKETFFFSFFFFRWLNPLLSQGSKRPLVAEDFYGVTVDNGTGVLGDDLQRFAIHVILGQCRCIREHRG